MLLSGSYNIEIHTPTRIITGKNCDPEFHLTAQGGNIIGNCEQFINERRVVNQEALEQGSVMVRVANMSGTMFGYCQLLDITRRVQHNSSTQTISLACNDKPIK